MLISCSHVLRCYNIVFVESLQSRAKPDVLCTRLWNHEKPERADVRDKSDKSEQISLNDLISMETKCRKVALVTGHCLVHHKTVHQKAVHQQDSTSQGTQGARDLLHLRQNATDTKAPMVASGSHDRAQTCKLCQSARVTEQTHCA